MSPAPSTTETAVDRGSAGGQALVDGLGTAMDERPRAEPGRCEPLAHGCPEGTGQTGRPCPGKTSPDGRYAPAPGLVVHVEEEPHERASTVAAVARRKSKLARGARSWLHAHLLLGGSDDGPWDYHFIEDDYRRLSRWRQESGVFRQR
jgi:hypothetical protein